MKVTNVKVPKAGRITHSFTAGENITAGMVVEISAVADNTVLIADTANKARAVGVALNDALITEIVEVCVYGVVEVTAAADVTSGDLLAVSGTIGRVYRLNARPSAAGAAHTHGSSLTVGGNAGTIAGAVYNATFADDFCAEDSGGATDKGFFSIQAKSIADAATATHTHTIGGTIDDESTHTHEIYLGQILGKALESFTAGNTGLILVCLTG